MDVLTKLFNKLSDQFDTFVRRVDLLEKLYLNHRHKGFDKSKVLSSDGIVYGGAVNADGTAGDLPSGWSSAKTATGAYTITHNLNSTSYALSMLPSGSQFAAFSIVAKNANNFQCITDSLLIAAADCAFDFLLVPTR